MDDKENKTSGRGNSPGRFSIFKDAFDNPTDNSRNAESDENYEKDEAEKETDEGYGNSEQAKNDSLDDDDDLSSVAAAYSEKVERRANGDIIVHTDVGDKKSRCPKCGSTNLTVDEKEGKLRCHDCRSLIDPIPLDATVHTMAQIFDMKDRIIGSGATNIKAGKDIMTIKCSGCGAEVVINTAKHIQARCPWCRTTLSVQNQVPNGSVPDGVLPFHLTREEAETKIMDFVNQRKTFADKRFKATFSVNDIMGIYLPYMIIDATGHGSVMGTGEVQTACYKEKVPEGSVNQEYMGMGSGGYGGHSMSRMSTSFSFGGSTGSNGKTRYVTKTFYDADVYSVKRAFDLAFRGLTIEASRNRYNRDNSKRTNNILNSIMPFDTENLVKWDAAYLRGYASEKRDVDVDNMTNVMTAEARDIGRRKMQPTVSKYDRGVRWQTDNFKLKGSQWMAAYFPVWLYSYKSGSQEHLIAVNARTGETMGSIPMNKLLMLLVGAVIDIAIFAVMLGVVYLASEADSVLQAFKDCDFRVQLTMLIVGIVPGIVFYQYIYRSYRNQSARNTYESETLSSAKNVKYEDTFIHSRNHTESKELEGRNEGIVFGNNAKMM